MADPERYFSGPGEEPSGNGQAPRPQKAVISVSKTPDQILPSTPAARRTARDEAFGQYQQALESSKGKGVRGSAKIRNAAKMALRAQYSEDELLQVLQDPRFSIRGHFYTLVEIRDNPEYPPKDRMKAADKIQQCIVMFMKAMGHSPDGDLSALASDAGEEERRIFAAISVVQAADEGVK